MKNSYLAFYKIFLSVFTFLVNGWFEDWSTFSPCSVTCGDGHKTRTRTCHRPLHGGLPCHGKGTQTMTCTAPPCPGYLVNDSIDVF